MEIYGQLGTAAAAAAVVVVVLYSRKKDAGDANEAISRYNNILSSLLVRRELKFSTELEKNVLQKDDFFIILF